MFDRVLIVGVGLLGASLGMALKRNRLAGRIVGLGRSGSPSLATAVARGAVDEGADRLEAAAAGADLIVLCTPVMQFAEMLTGLRPVLGAHTLVTDVGSTKQRVMGWASEHLGAGASRFVGSHPMAGSEKRGPEHARADLFENALCLLTPTAATDPAALIGIERLWQGVGMRTIRVDPASHDRWVAAVSHLPHVMAFALMTAASKEREALEAAAGSFVDMTRVAASDVQMWRDIFLTNPEALLGQLDAFSGEIAALRAAIAAGDAGAITDYLTRAKSLRDAFAAARNPTSH